MFRIILQLLILCISFNLTFCQTEIEVEDIDGDGDAILKLITTDLPADDTHRDMIIGFNQSNDGFIRMISDNDLSLWTNNTKRISIKNDGEIGFGTTNPLSPYHFYESGVLFGSRSDIITLESDNSHRPAFIFRDDSSNGITTMGIEYDNFFSTKGLKIFGTEDQTMALFDDSGLNTSFHPNSTTSGESGLRVQNADTDENWTMYTSGVTGNLLIYSSNDPNDLLGSFNYVSGAYSSFSDITRKKNIAPLNSILDKVLLLNPLSYHLKNQKISDKKIFGFSAQEVIDIFPELVNYHEDAATYTFNYSGLGPIAIAAIQEQQTQIDNLKAENILMKKELAAIKKLLSQ